jgi:hypothetical protein
VALDHIRFVRNFIAHGSETARKQYGQVLRWHFGTMPLKFVPPGRYLLLQSKNDPTKHYLLFYLEKLRQVGKGIAD